LLCGAEVTRWRECGVCTSCWGRVLQLNLRIPWCACCGLPFQFEHEGAGHLCVGCSVGLPLFTGARSFGYYTAELSRLIQGFKFDGRRNLAQLLAPLLAAALASTWSRSDFDLIIPVPLHPRRHRERGFNQSALLAARLAKYLVLPYSERALTRIRHTPPQVGLADAERLRNLSGAFRCGRPDLVARRRILLVDDVMTTGATAASASEALRVAGASSVAVLTVARAVPGVGRL